MNDKELSSFFAGLRPDPLMTISEWADTHRFLPQRSSPEPGKWRTDRTPYLREIMDCLSPSSPIDKVVLQKGSQIGGTEAGMNWIGAVIHIFPGPIMAIQPTVELGKRWSKQRMAPTIEETPVLRDLVKEPRERDSGNTVLMKEFRSGVLIITGANSAVGLRSMPAKYLFLDEIDAYPSDVEGEGDPVALAIRRTSNFPGKKVFLVSTPTVKGISRIEREYEASDMRKYFVSCPFCDHRQWLQWSGITWTKDDAGQVIPESVGYRCESCGEIIPERYKTQLLANGEWIATRPDASKNVAGFHLSALYAPLGWISWLDIILEFYAAKDDSVALKTWTNTILGETWEESGETIEETFLYDRREDYGPELEENVALLTCGVDIQRDRIVLEIVGWGPGEESWGIDFATLYGSPAELRVWDDLDRYLARTWSHKLGPQLRITSACVDSGFYTKEVYLFCKPRERHRIYAIKGSNQPGRAIVSKATIVANGVHLFQVGVDAAKETIYGRLKLDKEGPRFMHFPLTYEMDYFLQLTAEKQITKFNKGFPHREWVKVRSRNEALDCRVYAMAALAILNTDLGRALARLHPSSREETPPPQNQSKGNFILWGGTSQGWPSNLGGNKNWVKNW
jgi:phage terminase large subunit GpA-like protein